MYITMQAIFLVKENRDFKNKAGEQVQFSIVRFLEGGDVFEASASKDFEAPEPNSIGIFKIELKPEIKDNRVKVKMKVLAFDGKGK